VNINIPSTNIIDFAVVIISLLFSISFDVVVVVEAVAAVGEEGTDDEVLILDGEDGADDDDVEDGLILLCVL
jgi:hypothetical protein